MNNSLIVSEKDELIMRIVHYFVTKENYAPIVVNGVKNEIWLENLDAYYKIIRINSNYIHNNEQFEFDIFKILNVNKQISKKTLTRKLKTLNILTDTNDLVDIEKCKNINIDNLIIKSTKDLEEKDGIVSLFPEISKERIKDLHGLDFLINISNDINKKTEKENKFYESVFKKKPIIATKILIALNILMFLVYLICNITHNYFITNSLVLEPNLVKSGQIYRLITCGFLHANIMHLLCNMYSLYIVGSQVENFIGKKKFLIVYFISMITGSLLSCVVTNGVSVGASGAIFGIFGSLLYFGYHYRIYLGSVLTQQLLPLLGINLLISLLPGIDLGAHIGGLVGGIFATMMVGIENKTKKSDRINGTITLTILIIFLVYMIFR